MWIVFDQQKGQMSKIVLRDEYTEQTYKNLRNNASDASHT